MLNPGERFIPIFSLKPKVGDLIAVKSVMTELPGLVMDGPYGYEDRGFLVLMTDMHLTVYYHGPARLFDFGTGRILRWHAPICVIQGLHQTQDDDGG